MSNVSHAQGQPESARDRTPADCSGSEHCISSLHTGPVTGHCQAPVEQIMIWIRWGDVSVPKQAIPLYVCIREAPHLLDKIHCQYGKFCLWMNNFFGPPLETFCPLFKHFAQLGSKLPRLQFILPTFKFRPGKGVFWCELGVYIHIPEWGVTAEYRTGVWGGIWARWDPIWAKWEACEQFVWKVGKSALELGEKNSVIYW